MNTINISGFTAEAVFYGTTNQYRHDGEVAQRDSRITPAMICFGDDDCNRMFSGTSCPSGGTCFILPRGGGDLRKNAGPRDARGHHRRRARTTVARADLHTTVWLSCSTRFPLTIKPPTAWRCAGRSGMDMVTSVPGDVERTSNCPPDASTLARIDAIPI